MKLKAIMNVQNLFWKLVCKIQMYFGLCINFRKKEKKYRKNNPFD